MMYRLVSTSLSKVCHMGMMCIVHRKVIMAVQDTAHGHILGLTSPCKCGAVDCHDSFRICAGTAMYLEYSGERSIPPNVAAAVVVGEVYSPWVCGDDGAGSQPPLLMQC